MFKTVPAVRAMIVNDVLNNKAWLENRGTSFELTNGITDLVHHFHILVHQKMLTSRLRHTAGKVHKPIITEYSAYGRSYSRKSP